MQLVRLLWLHHTYHKQLCHLGAAVTSLGVRGNCCQIHLQVHLNSIVSRWCMHKMWMSIATGPACTERGSEWMGVWLHSNNGHAGSQTGHLADYHLLWLCWPCSSVSAGLVHSQQSWYVGEDKAETSTLVDLCLTCTQALAASAIHFCCVQARHSWVTVILCNHPHMLAILLTTYIHTTYIVCRCTCTAVHVLCTSQPLLMQVHLATGCMGPCVMSMHMHLYWLRVIDVNPIKPHLATDHGMLGMMADWRGAYTAWAQTAWTVKCLLLQLPSYTVEACCPSVLYNICWQLYVFSTYCVVCTAQQSS